LKLEGDEEGSGEEVEFGGFIAAEDALFSEDVIESGYD
jgi:hypothetical protein